MKDGRAVYEATHGGNGGSNYLFFEAAAQGWWVWSDYTS
jgi:hypothetical protein